MRIGILNTDTLKTEFDTKYGQYPVMFSNVLLQADPNIQIRTYEVQFGDYPAAEQENVKRLDRVIKKAFNNFVVWANEI